MILFLVVLALILNQSVSAQHTLIDVSVSANSGEALRIDNSSGTHAPYLTLYRNGLFRGFLQAASDKFEIGSSNSMPMVFTLNGSEMMRVHSNGNIGIGMTTPTTGRLVVNTPDNTIHGIHVIATNFVGSEETSERPFAAIYGQNQATNNKGAGLFGLHSGLGSGVFGYSANGKGISGNSAAGIGVFGYTYQGVAVSGQAEDGIGVRGESGSSSFPGILAINSSNQLLSKALEIKGGYMKSSGEIRTAFRTESLSVSLAIISLSYYGQSGNGGQEASDILIVTPNHTDNSAAIPQFHTKWNTSTNRWEIHKSAGALNFPIGTTFNILIIKQ